MGNYLFPTWINTLEEQMPEIPDRIKQLVETFARNIDSYKSGNMNEMQLVYRLYGLTEEEIKIVEGEWRDSRIRGQKSSR